MAECDIKNSDHLIANKSSLISSSSLDDNDNIQQQSSATNLDGKTKRKTHRLKQRFQVVKKLGQGTYGKVQLAINNESGQEVAIKTIKKNKVSNQQDLVRIRREIQIMSSINHPNIIHIFEVFENKDKIVLVMQYASGGELYDYVSYHKALSDMEARRVFRQIATAIYYCHKNKICHRDLKLENILLDEKGNAKIADFGLSNVFDDKHFLQTFCGSPLYASPEIVRGLPYFGPEVDCWSLGVLLYTLVYGAMPFDGSNFKKLVKQISEANFFEPPEKSPATELIHKLLTPEPKERASIIDICMDPWVNQDSEHLLLQVAEDMSNLTNHAVRLDMLLALAPGSVAATAATAASATPSNDEQTKPADSNVGDDQSNKRPNETNDSLADLAGKKTTKKKSKKNLSNEQIMTTTENDLVKQKPEEEKIIDEKPSPESNQEKLIDEIDEIDQEKENFETISTPVNEQPPSTKIAENETTTIDKNDKNSSQTSLKSTGSSGSITTKKRGRISIPKIWDDNQEKLKTSSTNSSMGSPRKEPKSPGLFSVSELKKELEQRTKLDAVPTTLTKRRDTLADTSELKQQSSAAIMENVKKYKNRSISLNLNQVIDEQKNKTVVVDQDDKSKLLKSEEEESPLKSTIKDDDGGQFVDEKTTSTSKTSSTSSIKSDDKSLAKQIIQKNIAKAKLMEKRQTSVQSTTTTTATDLQSGETTPLISIENSTISSMMRNSPNSSTSNVFFRTKSGLNDTLVDNGASGSGVSTPTTKDINQQLSSSTSIDQSIVVNPAPIARSYKKIIFTKDGAKITETGKFYSHEGDGVTTRVEKTSRITIKNNNDNNSSSSTTATTLLQRSDSQSSTGSLDIFDDIFEDHWTDSLFSDAKSLFNNFFGRRSEKLSLRSRAESLERTANFFPGRSTDSIRSERKFPTTYRDRDLFERQGNSSFGSHKSLFQKSIFSNSSSFSKSSMMNDKNSVDFDNIIDRGRSRIDDLKQKYGLGRFVSSASASASASSADQMRNDFFNNRNRRMMFDDDDHNDNGNPLEETTNKSRIEQWLDNHHHRNDNDNDYGDGRKDFDNCMNTYGTMMMRKPANRFSRTTTNPINLTTSKNSNVKTDFIKHVEITDSSATCQVIRHKTSQMKTSDNIIPRDIQLNFKLDEQTGGLILNQTNIVPVNLDMMNKNLSTSSTSTSTATATTTNELKIEEPSSLLEQLRTFGYKKLVDRRLSDSSSTEDLPTANTVIESSSASMMTSSSNKSSERNVNVQNDDNNDDKNCLKNDNNKTSTSTSVADRNDEDKNNIDINGYLERKKRLIKQSIDNDDISNNNNNDDYLYNKILNRSTSRTRSMINNRFDDQSSSSSLLLTKPNPLLPLPKSSSSSFNNETVEERIHRKSYYSRFNNHHSVDNDQQQRQRQRQRRQSSVSRLFNSSFDGDNDYDDDYQQLRRRPRLYSHSFSNNSFVQQRYNDRSKNDNNDNDDNNRIYHRSSTMNLKNQIERSYQRFNSFDSIRRSSSLLRDQSQTRIIRSRFLRNDNDYNDSTTSGVVDNDDNKNRKSLSSSTTSNIIDRIRAASKIRKQILNINDNDDDDDDENITVTNGQK